MRGCALRIGIAMSPASGALGRMLPAFKAGAGARLGDGKQWMAIVSVDEVAAMFYRAVVDESMSGAYNATGVEPLTNLDFTALVGRILHRPAPLAIPRFAARAMFGRAADEAYLASQRAIPARLTATAHPFRHASAEAALRHVLGR
jgi:NAD dependent epimerase/dehydratase family enzyme